MSVPGIFFDLAEMLAVKSPYANKRQFSLPLAAHVPPDGANDPLATPTSSDMPNRSIYSFADQYVHDNANNVTKEVGLVIGIKGPFAPDFEGNLPPASIRVHAITGGKLGFRQPNVLVLRTSLFKGLTETVVPWWRNWSDANCIPVEILYENVDINHLTAYLTNKLPAAGGQGLKFPGSKTPIDRNQFVQDFFTGAADANGDPVVYFTAEPGAVIGRADLATATGNDFQLIIRARYSDHLKPREQPMNPRELLYLLFGEDSSPAQNHPLLRALNTLRPPPTKPRDQMTLRPPLRTWARLMWEAQRERDEDATLAGANRHWSAPGNLGTAQAGQDRLFDTLFKRNNGSVSYSGVPNGTNKCNIFTSEICVRAGFRAMVGQLSSGVWHYIRANAHANAGVASLAANKTTPPGRYQIMGAVEDAGRLWGWVLTHYLLAKAKTLDEINEMMHAEGRALIVAGMRPARGFVTGGGGTLTDQSGHIVLLRKLEPWPNPPVPASVPNPFLLTNTDPKAVGMTTRIGEIYSFTAQASGADGAQANFPYEMVVLGRTKRLPASKTGAAGGSTGFFRLHLLEASPGRDPDLLQGTFDLHIKALDRVRLADSPPDAIP